MGPKRKPIRELGVVQTYGQGGFRARIQRRDEYGFEWDIPGPRRWDKLSAEKDLEELRAAGEKASPDKAWKAMSNHGLRLRIRAHDKPAPPKVKRASSRAGRRI